MSAQVSSSSGMSVTGSGWAGGDQAQPAELPPLPVFRQIHDRPPQVGHVVVDLPPPRVRGGEGGLDQVLARVSRASHQEG